MTRPILIDFNVNEYKQGLRQNLDRFNGSCNTPDDPSGRICALNKTENVKFSVF